MFNRSSAIAWLLATCLVATTLGAAGVGLRTGAGRSVVTRYGEAVLNSVVRGTAEVGEVSGSLTEGFHARDVYIRGEDGTLLAHFPSVRLSYRVLDFLTGHVAFGDVELVEPYIQVVKREGGRFNYQEVLRLGGSGEGDDGVASPLVEFRNASIVGGTVVIRTPIDGDEEHDYETELTEWGLMRVRRLDDLNADVSYARIVSPIAGESGLRFDIEELRTRLTDPDLDIRGMQGRMEIDGDSIRFDLSRLALPGTETELVGALKWPNGPLLIDLDINASRLDPGDAGTFTDKLPFGLVGYADIGIHSLSADRLRVSGTPLRLRAPDGDGVASGNFAVVVDDDGWRMEDTDLLFDHLPLEYLKPFLDTIPFVGWLSGRFAAEGRADSLEVEADLRFEDRTVLGQPESHLRGSGVMDLGHADGFAFVGFALDSSDVSLATVRELLPVVGLQGRLEAIGSLNGPWRNAQFRGTGRHRHGVGPQSVARGTVRIDSRTDTVGVWADLTMDSLDFAGIHPSYPRVPERGVVAGTVWLQGFSDSLVFRADLSGPPGRLDATGHFILLPGRVGVGDLVAGFRKLDLARLAAAAPSSELLGRVLGSVTSYGDTVSGLLRVSLDTSIVVDAPIDSASGIVHFADNMIRFDSVDLYGPALRFAVRGGLGMAPERRGLLELRAEIDSLDVVESVLRDRFPMFDRDSLLDGLVGRVLAHVTLDGSIYGYDADLVLDVPYAVSNGGRVEGLDLRLQWPAAMDGPLSVEGAIDSLFKGPFRYADLRLSASGLRNNADWTVETKLGDVGSWMTAAGGMRTDSGTITIPVDSFDLQLPVHRWSLRPRSVLQISETGYGLDSLVFTSDDGAGRVEFDGTIPRGGAPGNLAASIVALPLTDIYALAQQDTSVAEGILGGSISLFGTATDPVWRVALQLNDGRVGQVTIPPLLEVTADYSERRLEGEGGLWQQGQQILSLRFALPLDLALEGVEDRILEGPLSIDAVADGVDLALLESVTPSVRGATGMLDADVGIAGSWRQPQLRGELALARAGAFLPTIGVTYHDVDGSFTLSGDTILVDSLTIRTGDGLANIEGLVRLEELARPILQLQVAADRFHTLDVSEVLDITVSGDFNLDGPLIGATLTGQGVVTEGELYVADVMEKRIVNLQDTIFSSIVDAETIREQGLAADFANRLVDSLGIDSLSLEMGTNVRLLSSEADIQLEGNLLLSKNLGQYRFDGTLSTPRGTYRLPLSRGFGAAELIIRDFDVTDGEVLYFGTSDLDAALDVNAQYEVRTTRGEDLRVFVNVGGTLYTPRITLTSDVRPVLPEDEIISYLLFNAPSVEAIDGRELGFALTQLYGTLSSELGSLITDLGVPVDYLRIRPPTQGLSGAEIALGWQLGPKTFVTLSPRICQRQRGLSTLVGASFEYRFSRSWLFAASRDPVNACTLLGGVSRLTKSQLGFDVFWEKRY